MTIDQYLSFEDFVIWRKIVRRLKLLPSGLRIDDLGDRITEIEIISRYAKEGNH